MTVPLINTAILAKKLSWQANMSSADPSVVTLPARTVPPIIEAASATFPPRLVCVD